MGSGNANGDIATGVDRRNWDVGPARLIHKPGTDKLAIDANCHVGSRDGIHLKGFPSYGEDVHVAHIVGCRLYAIWHDGTIAQHMIAFPIILGVAVDAVSKGSSRVARKIAGKKDGTNGVVGVIPPDGIITAHSGLFVGWHNANLSIPEVCVDDCGTHTKIIVVIPGGGRA